MSQDVIERLRRFSGRGLSSVDVAVNAAEEAVRENRPLKTSLFNNFGGAKTAVAQAILLESTLSTGFRQLPVVLKMNGLDPAVQPGRRVSAGMSWEQQDSLRSLFHTAFTGRGAFNMKVEVPFLDSEAMAVELLSGIELGRLKAICDVA